MPPPDNWITTHPPPSVPPGPEATLMPDPGPGEVPAAANAPPPALPEFIEPLFQQAPVPVMETSGQRPQNSTSAGPLDCVHLSRHNYTSKEKHDDATVCPDLCN
ncbi:unnamed protein product [Rangifer tarandus platyrhynchus]|uniref:Uncharacterized protein n=2 Tax=Rangifer tarandus platyrhynchus TaxID=3082113 RepID=A0AC59YEA8_RANTA|nr:unnamed protein product [Rangifer tarandus platyrhynchus]